MVSTGVVTRAPHHQGPTCYLDLLSMLFHRRLPAQ